VGNLFDLPIPFLLLLPVSLAAGADFFLTLLILAALEPQGLGSGGLGAIDPTLAKGLAVLVFILYGVEALAEVRAFPALVWHNLQLVFRPLGGVLLALTLLEGLPFSVRFLGAVAAAVLCAFSHVLSWGRKVIFFLDPRRRLSPFSRILGEDVLVLGILYAAAQWPEAAFVSSLLFLLLGLLLGASSHQATGFGFLLLRGRVKGLFQPPTWVEGEELPGWVQRARERGPAFGFRGIPGAVRNLPGVGGFRECWILEADGGRQLLYRWRRGPRVFSLEGVETGVAQQMDIAERIPVTGPGRDRWALFLQSGSPGLESHK